MRAERSVGLPLAAAAGGRTVYTCCLLALLTRTEQNSTETRTDGRLRYGTVKLSCSESQCNIAIVRVCSIAIIVIRGFIYFSYFPSLSILYLSTCLINMTMLYYVMLYY